MEQQQTLGILTREEAARELRISVSTLDRRRRDGRIHDTRLSERRVGITRSELKRYIAEMKFSA